MHHKKLKNYDHNIFNFFYFKNIVQLNIESEFINGEDEWLGVDAEESIFENFSENKLKVYINDSLYSLLLNSLFSQFGEVYKKQMHPKARKKICWCVNILIKKD